MATITAGMVAELRGKTDAPMMECKKLLTEAEGDMVKAEEILRVKLGNKASKAASRIAAEGIVALYISADRKLGAIVEVNSETDFVAKNDEFIALAKGCAELVATKTWLMSLRYPCCQWARVLSNRPALHWLARSVKTCRSVASSVSRPLVH